MKCLIVYNREKCQYIKHFHRESKIVRVEKRFTKPAHDVVSALKQRLSNVRKQKEEIHPAGTRRRFNVFRTSERNIFFSNHNPVLTLSFADAIIIL